MRFVSQKSVKQHSYDPDLLYFDNGLFPLGWAGMNVTVYFCNHNLQTLRRKIVDGSQR